MKGYVPSSYDVVARHAPAFLGLMPVAVTIAATNPVLWTVTNTLVGVAVTFGALIPLASLTRALGTRVQPTLWEYWDGKPTVRFLRHRDETIQGPTKDRYRALAERLIGQPLPTPEEENASPDAADAVYDAIGDKLRILTRNESRWYLIAKENKNYGFSRNAYGLRHVARLVSLGSLGWLLSVMWPLSGQSLANTFDNIEPLLLVALLLVAAAGAFWMVMVQKTWVADAADTYALRLLEALDDPDIV